MMNLIINLGCTTWEDASNIEWVLQHPWRYWETQNLLCSVQHPDVRRGIGYGSYIVYNQADRMFEQTWLSVA